jgi:hypothetical protein
MVARDTSPEPVDREEDRLRGSALEVWLATSRRRVLPAIPRVDLASAVTVRQDLASAHRCSSEEGVPPARWAAAGDRAAPTGPSLDVGTLRPLA